MWKLAASIATAAAVGGPVTVALAAEQTDAPAAVPATVDLQDRLELRAAQGEGHRADTAAEARAERRAERRQAQRRKARRARAARRGAAGGAAAGTSKGSAAPVSGNLAAIAACESGGNPGAVGGGGAYRGKYQFDQSTWASVGGSGDPAAASEAEQDKRAAALYAKVGSSAWPSCGR